MIKTWTVGLAVLVFPILALAVDPSFLPVDNEAFFSAIFAALSSLKGAGTLSIVLLVAQLLMKFGGTPLFDALKLDPKYKFLAFAILSTVVSTIGLMVGTELTFVQAVMANGGLLPIINYLYKIYELFFEKKAVVA